MTGFGNHFATEAVPGALPVGRNSPQKVPFGLYAEQLSGTAFTAPRAENRRSWLYRLRPAAQHPPFKLVEAASQGLATFSGLTLNKVGSGYTLKVSSSGLTGTTSRAITVTNTATSSTLAAPAGTNVPDLLLAPLVLDSPDLWAGRGLKKRARST